MDSSGSSSRAAAPVASARDRALRRVPRRPRPHRAARVRALRLPGAWPVRRCVECRGPAARVRAGARRARLRRRARRDRVGLEGARPARARRRARGLVVEVVARPAVDALTPVPGDRERGRERGPRPRGATRAGARDAAGSCRPVALVRAREAPTAGRPPRGADRSANVRGAFTAPGAGAATRRARRRRLHDRRHRLGVRLGAPSRGRSARRGRLPGAGSALG